MKKLILAFVALAFAFAISSCCDQGHYLSRKKCVEKEEEECRPANRGFRQGDQGEETPYRWDKANREEKSGWRPNTQKNCPENPPQERQHRRW